MQSIITSCNWNVCIVIEVQREQYVRKCKDGLLKHVPLMHIYEDSRRKYFQDVLQIFVAMKFEVEVLWRVFSPQSSYSQFSFFTWGVYIFWNNILLRVRGATSSSFRWGGGILMQFHSIMSSCLFNRSTTFSQTTFPKLITFQFYPRCRPNDQDRVKTSSLIQTPGSVLTQLLQSRL